MQQSADPLFVDEMAQDYHLAVGSPCIDTGYNLAPGLPPFDIEGKPRLDGDSVDMGGRIRVRLVKRSQSRASWPLTFLPYIEFQNSSFILLDNLYV
jgi:hypothetical protein